jgi:predicted NBD/HSP70 family sugar kinase
MSQEVGPGFCIALGGTNAREAWCAEGDITHPKSERTPSQPQDLFPWIGRRLLAAAAEGAEWGVVSVPGPVKCVDGTALVGPLFNVPGLSQRAYDLRHELGAVDPALHDLLDNPDFALHTVNDGDLAAQAVGVHMARPKDTSVGALIVGTGVGLGIVLRRGEGSPVWDVPSWPLEFGHAPQGIESRRTIEDTISGTAIAQRFGNPERLPHYHPAWYEVGRSIGFVATTLGVLLDVDLIVPTGGVGAGAASKYRDHLEMYLRESQGMGNVIQVARLPRIDYIPVEEAHFFELFGAAGVASAAKGTMPS